LILFNIICHLVNSLPFPLIKNNIQNNDLLNLLINDFEWVLGGSSETLINLQKAKDFDGIDEITEKNIKPIFDNLLHLFRLPFNHPDIQEIHNDTEFERNRGECQAPDSCFLKKQGENVCTVCEDDISAVTDLIDFFQESRNSTELMDMAEKCKHVLNEYVFNFALTNVCGSKFPGFEYPSIIEVFPGMFINKSDLNSVRQEVSEKHRLKRQAVSADDPVTVHVNPVFDGEQNLNYFTEDYGYNSHHFNWHILYRVHSGTDRRGELFYYMHQQMVARYDLERMSLGLDRVKSSGPLNIRIPDGYFPNLDPSTNGNEWARRYDNTMPRSIVENRRVTYDVNNINLWQSRLSQAAIDGFMIDKDGQRVVLSDDVDINSGARRGIDIFTAAAESDAEISPNVDFYGNLHNTGHNIICRLHDPEHHEQFPILGVMASAAVSGRDPAFYNWHKYFDDLIQEYKRTQAPYSRQRLELVNIFLSEVKIGYSRPFNQERIDGNLLGPAGVEYNTFQSELLTGCNTYKIDISRGLDFGNEHSVVIADLKHLDHVPFHYNISVVNNRPERKNIMVRIFLAPKYGKYEQILPLNEQRHLFVLLDKFKYTYRGLFGGGHCGCGWPHHLLLPRGSPQGMRFQFFVILTDWDRDYVPSETIVSSLCGVVGDKYPDWQPMGYPFDRPFHQNVANLDQLAGHLPNAHASDVSIRFMGRNIINDERC